MAIASYSLIEALRTTAGKLASADNEYRWTHMGACNCGHLAQHITGMSASEIRRLSQYKAGEWADQALEYCETSNLPIDHVMGSLLELGLEPRDVGHLERLSDPSVLRRFSLEKRHLDFRQRIHVVMYMRAWADMLEEQLEVKMKLENLQDEKTQNVA